MIIPKKSVSTILLLTALAGGSAQAMPTRMANAQEVKQGAVVRGKVQLATGEPAVGASVAVIGTKLMTVVDNDGNFTLKGVKPGASIRFGLVGCKSQVVKYTGGDLNISLEEVDNSLKEAVVTAMGIQRKAKSLTYSTQQIKADDLTKVEDPNIANSLEGKVAGVTITPSAGGAGGASKIQLRGSKSILGNSAPLIVIDGVPMTNGTRGQMDFAGSRLTAESSVEGSDPLSMINPDDIESMNVLKGANAAALYGSAAANGVLMITTKKGKEGRLGVTFSSNVTFDSPLLTPKIQNVYGAPITAGGGLEINNWGERLDSRSADNLVLNVPNSGLYFGGIGGTRQVQLRNQAGDDVADFYRTGVTTNNSISLSGGTEKIKTYFSYANSHAKGMVESNAYNRNTFAFRQTYHLFNRLQIDASINYIQTKTRNRLGGGTVLNPIYHLYMTPRNVDMAYYRDNYRIDDGRWMSSTQSYFVPSAGAYKLLQGQQVELKGPMQNWAYMTAANNNPYWLLKQNNSMNKEDRVFGSVTGKVDIYDGLSFQARFSFDHTRYNSEGRRYATTWLPSPMDAFGTYFNSNDRTTELYTDYLLSYNKTFQEDWSVSATAGWVGHLIRTNGQSTYTTATYVDGARLQPSTRVNWFDTRAGGGGTTSSSRVTNWDKAALFTAQFGWKDAIYLDASYRQDWYRAFKQFEARGTKASYGYFGVGASAIISSLAKLPEQINYMKYRVSYSEVGNTIPNIFFSKGTEDFRTGAIAPSTFSQFKNPKPETTASFETGLEMLLFNSRLNVDLSFYNAVSRNQYMLGEANASGLREPFNSGKIRNTGIEATVGYNFYFGDDWRWKTSVNFAYNSNKILETAYETDGSEKKIYQNVGGVRVRYNKGGAIGDMYVTDYKRDADGHFLLNNAGKPQMETEADKIYTKFIGNMNSKVQLGWSNTVTYKDFQLFFLVNGRIGGKVISLTEARLDQAGLSQRTADARLAGEAQGLTLNGQTAMYLPDGSGRLIGVKDYYQTVSELDPSLYLYNGTNFRLRELSLGYTFRNFLGENKNLSLSFIARNLFFIYKDSPTDPDVSLSTQNGLGAFEVFNMPSSRSFGFSMKLNF